MLIPFDSMKYKPGQQIYEMCVDKDQDGNSKSFRMMPVNVEPHVAALEPTIYFMEMAFPIPSVQYVMLDGV